MPRDSMSESGVFYLVPNKQGPGKTFVRRPNPPPTSAPLDDDFDAFTQGCTTTRGLGSEWGTRRGRYSTAPTAPPLDDDFDAITQGCTTTMGPESEWGTRHRRNSGVPPMLPPPEEDYETVSYAVPHQTEILGELESDWNPHDRFRDQARPRNGDPSGYRNPSGERRRERKDSTGGFENYGEYGQYMNEMEKMFGGSVDLELSVRRVGQEDESRPTSRQIGRVRSISGSSLTNGRRGIAGPRGGGQRSRLGPAGGGAGGDGPKAGQDYEVINRRILEDGPEKTVTISTWREQVANEAKSEAEMSVYYLSADDYAVDGGDGATEVDSHAHRTRRGSPQERRRSGGFSSPNNSGIRDPGRGKQLANQGWSSPEKPTTQRKTFSDPTYASRSEGIQSPDTFGTHRSGSPQAKNQRRPSATYRGDSYRTDLTPPRKSTPPRENPSRGSPSPPRRIATPPRTSTPTRTYGSPPPFNPTQSGSTISSIKSSSTKSFEKVLSSCEPSMLHVAPILASLGITREEHLRAVARLSEDTRDREVREEALRKGVTVMEWAILLDRLQAL